MNGFVFLTRQTNIKMYKINSKISRNGKPFNNVRKLNFNCYD